MHRRSLAVGVSLTCALAVGVAQQAPTPTPGAAPSFRSGISYIELDASVLDRNRNPVRGLSAGDFTVLEDGQPQKILSFSEVNVPDPAPPPVSWMRDVTPDVQTNDQSVDARLVVIFMDDGQAPGGGLNRSKEVANMLIDRLGPADRAAVVFARLSGAQDFTSDHAKLQSAINRFSPFTPPGGGLDLLENAIVRLGMIATNLAALPGKRKALFYFGIGVPMPHPERNPDEFRAYNDLTQVFRDAQRANVNIYPIDPSGLEAPSDFDVLQRRAVTLTPVPSPTMTSATEFYQTVADNTGGVAIVNRNDFETVVPRVLRENGSYYLLGYESPNLKTDGRLRKIDVTVNRSDVTVRARSGYFGAKSDATTKQAQGPKALSPALETAGTALVQSPAVRMQVSTAAFAVPEKPGAAVAITTGVRPEALENTSQIDEVNLLAEAFTPDGDKAASVFQPFRIGTGVKQYELFTRLDLKPGRYQLRVSTESKLRGKAGSVFADMEVPDFSKPFSMSGMVVHAEPALTAPSDTGMMPLAPLVPTTMRDFSSDQQVTTFLRIYQGGNGKLADVPLSVRIRDVRDRVVFETSQNLNANRFDATGAAEYRLAVPVDKLAPGPYLLTIEGKLKKDTARRDVRFEMHASTASEPTSADVPAQPGLDGVLARMAGYLAAYADQYASTIATEHYKQADRSGTRDVELALEAEFGILRLPGSQWLGFRDVTSVNGRSVADHEGRLARIFLDPSADAIKQADKITEESTRFNIGPILRTINNPAIVLEALDARNQSRFKFSKAGEETLEGTHVWALRFTEQARPTFITTFQGRNEPLTGRTWVDPLVGRPLRVELTIHAIGTRGPFTALVNVTFREDPRLGLWVPATMTERYEANLKAFATGDASYTNYRRFGVETKEELAK